MNNTTLILKKTAKRIKSVLSKCATIVYSMI